MSIYKKIKEDRDNARRSSLYMTMAMLSTLLGEMELKAILNPETNEKIVSDEVAMQIIRKFIKNNDEFMALSKDGEAKEGRLKENEILSSYLPTMLSEEELSSIIISVWTKTPNMKDVMSYLKENHNGLYDGKTASEKIKKLQNQT